MLSFEKTVSGLCDSFLLARCGMSAGELEAHTDEITRFLLAQHARMPDHLRSPLKVFTLLFDLMGVARGGRPFHRQPHAARWRQIESWRGSWLQPRRDLIRFYESLVLFRWYEDHDV